MGVVEDINDPLKMGRLRVRCYGYHSANKADIATSDLPWASVMMPITSASITGVGTSPVGIVAGSWVLGFFRDGPTCQDPVVMGTLPSSSTFPIIDTFSDPSREFPRYEGNDLPSIAIDEYDGSSQQSLKDEGISLGDQLTIPNPAAPEYPFNKATVTYSGHTIEVDDTPGAERIAVMDKNGTFLEMNNSGQVNVVRGNKYTVVAGSDFIQIKGTCNVYVEGDCNLTVAESCSTTAKNINLTASVKTTINAPTIEVNADTLVDITSAGTANVNGTTIVNISGAAINIG